MNGVFQIGPAPGDVSEPPGGPMPYLDGRDLTDKDRLLTALGRVLDFPDYYGNNWDALDECLADLSWHDGPLYLLISHAVCIPLDLRLVLTDIFADAAQHWAAQGRPFALFLQG